MPHYPHHAALFSLLNKKQFDACRLTVEEMIAQLMGDNATSTMPPTLSGQEILKQVNDRDRELACLHIIWCMSLFGVHKFRCAAEKADLAAFLAQKVGDTEILGEARYRAGVCYSSNGEYSVAICRLTECIDSGVVEFRGDAFYNRGFAHQALAAFDQAIPDYQAAIEWGIERRPDLVLRSRINLAWVLILSRDFELAERTLADLAAATRSDDRIFNLHIAHDQAHLLLLKGQCTDALMQAVGALNQCGQEHPDVRADIVLTLMAVAGENGLQQEAFTLGLLAKRLAGQARRFDLDEDASRRLQELERLEGTETLLKSLQQLRQVFQGSRGRRKASRVGDLSGGVG